MKPKYDQQFDAAKNDIGISSIPQRTRGRADIRTSFTVCVINVPKFSMVFLEWSCQHLENTVQLKPVVRVLSKSAMLSRHDVLRDTGQQNPREEKRCI